MIASTQITNIEIFTFIAIVVFKGTVMQIEKALINVRLRVLKVF